jgi:hypothetical protein
MPCRNQPRGGLAVESAAGITAGITTGITSAISLAMKSQSYILQSCNAKHALTAINISLIASQKTVLPECIIIKPHHNVQASMTAPDRLKGRATGRQHQQMRPQQMVQPNTRR